LRTREWGEGKVRTAPILHSDCDIDRFIMDR
jgi:hypothetical protein